MNLIKIQLADIGIWTADQLDGYGILHVSEAIHHIQTLRPEPARRALEWCSGPGYFGFMLYNYGLAQTVVLSDIHSPLESVVNKTIQDNHLEDHITFINSNNFDNLEGKFDLIIGNPPHFDIELEHTEENEHYNEHRKFIDKNWSIHQNFFENVGRHLTDDGSIILMENAKGSSPSTFQKMIEDNNLSIKNVIKSIEHPKEVWFMEIVKNG